MVHCSIIYLGMAQEIGILAELGVAQHGLNIYQGATSTTERLAQTCLQVLYAGGEK